MEIIQTYLNKVECANRIATPLLNSTAQADAERKANELTKELNNSSYIKVPFVGEFNASKSSLLNAYMGVNLLPTNITPETAVSYELYYSADEKLEVWHYGSLKECARLEQIAELKVVPGDIVKVYIDNERIRSLNDRGIVVVDMPGIDSGVEEHNNAIMNYIQEGTFYVIVSDIQHGTLTGTSLQFVQELKKYSISAAVLLSKIDRKPSEEVSNVLANVKDFAQRVIGPNTYVGAVSALSNQIGDMEKLLDTLDGKEFAEKKFCAAVDGFVNKQIAQLEFQANLLANDNSDFDAQLEKLEQKRVVLMQQLEQNDVNAQPIEGSVQDILDDIYNALFANAYQLASVVYAQKDSNALNNQILSIIRPVLVNSFKREIGEYQEVIGQTINVMADEIEAILKDENNPIIQQAEKLAGSLVGREIVEELLTKGLQSLLERFAGYKSITSLLGILGGVLNPIVGIIIGFIPDILRMIFGKGKDAKIAEIQQQLESTAFGQIVEVMRQPVTEMLEVQRRETFDNMKNAIDEELDSINAALSDAKAQKEADEAKNAVKIEALKDAVYQIKFELGMK